MVSRYIFIWNQSFEIMVSSREKSDWCQIGNAWPKLSQVCWSDSFQKLWNGSKFSFWWFIITLINSLFIFSILLLILKRESLMEHQFCSISGFKIYPGRGQQAVLSSNSSGSGHPGLPLFEHQRTMGIPDKVTRMSDFLIKSVDRLKIKI